MKIKTNAGEVELTAEMVCRGMVFTAADYHLGGGLFVVGRRDDANNVWRDAGDDGLGTNLLGAQRFLGCDPTVASRADCERFGVHGDAAAHGFARLRDGGAVDLRRVAIRGAVAMDTEHGARFTAHGCTLRKQDRFLGLDAHHANPEDVERLCCGEKRANMDGVVSQHCTLAIGDHDTHEDLATGVKWSARPNPLEHLRARAAAFVSQPVCADCDKPAEIELLARCGAQQRLLKRCGCGEKVITVADRDVAALPSPAIEWRNGSASLGQSQAHVLRDGDVYRWQVNHLGLRIRDGVSLLGDEARYEAACLLRDVHEATAGIEWLAGFLGLLFRVHDSTPAVMRAKQEAPLVALVAAVPAGLNPIGWRAAVLAVHECQSRYGSAIQGDHLAAWLMHSLREGMDDCDAGTPYAYGYHAYLRAITPAPKVDRVRATWKTRGPALACDNGEDE